jgi:hypothetical protein
MTSPQRIRAKAKILGSGPAARHGGSGQAYVVSPMRTAG